MLKIGPNLRDVLSLIIAASVGAGLLWFFWKMCTYYD
jgi:hypothetical protein